MLNLVETFHLAQPLLSHDDKSARPDETAVAESVDALVQQARARNEEALAILVQVAAGVRDTPTRAHALQAVMDLYRGDGTPPEIRAAVKLQSLKLFEVSQSSVRAQQASLAGGVPSQEPQSVKPVATLPIALLYLAGQQAESPGYKGHRDAVNESLRQALCDLDPRSGGAPALDLEGMLAHPCRLVDINELQQGARRFAKLSQHDSHLEITEQGQVLGDLSGLDEQVPRDGTPHVVFVNLSKRAAQGAAKARGGHWVAVVLQRQGSSDTIDYLRLDTNFDVGTRPALHDKIAQVLEESLKDKLGEERPAGGRLQQVTANACGPLLLEGLARLDEARQERPGMDFDDLHDCIDAWRDTWLKREPEQRQSIVAVRRVDMLQLAATARFDD